MDILSICFILFMLEIVLMIIFMNICEKFPFVPYILGSALLILSVKICVPKILFADENITDIESYNLLDQEESKYYFINTTSKYSANHINVAYLKDDMVEIYDVNNKKVLNDEYAHIDIVNYEWFIFKDSEYKVYIPRNY